MSSFVKIKKDDLLEITGLKISVRNGQVCSTGSDSLDFVIGGGIELNSLFLLGEDKYGKYSNVLTKLFLADAFHHNHRIYFANLDDDPRKIMRDIPMPIKSTPSKEVLETTDNDLRIAFRYQALPKLDSIQRGAVSGQINYDLTKKYELEKINSYEKIKYFAFENKLTETSAFDDLIKSLNSFVGENSNELTRICINSLGSPLWYSETFSDDLLNFLSKLKSIVRYNNIICFITMPLHLINLIDDQLIFKIRKLIDVNINLESFDNIDKQTNAVFKQYHGLLHIKKLQTLTAFQSHKPETFDLAFKLKLHKFVIEKLHLPPELQEGESTMSCSSIASGGGNKSLDF